MSTMMEQGILVVDDDARVLETVVVMLGRGGFGVVGTARDGDAALSWVGRKIDLALLDISLPGPSGLDVGRAMRAQGVPILYMSGCVDARTVERARETSPRGFVAKPFTEAQLLASVRISLSPAVKEPVEAALDDIARILTQLGIVSPARRPLDEPRAEASLSKREWEIVRLLADHLRVPTIAERLHISPATVRNHLKSAFQKVGVHSQEELLRRLW